MLARRRRKLGRRPPAPVRASTIFVGLAVGLLTVVAGCLMSPRPTSTVDVFPAGGPTIRVLILNDVPEVVLTVDGRERRVVASDLAGGAITFTPQSASPVIVNSKRDPRGREMSYRGKLRLVPDSRGIDVVNELTMEEYLLGVVPRESPASWPLDALKSQAVASRTYAIYNVQTGLGSKRAFDVYDDTRSQVYGGISGETDSGRQAVTGTAGRVLAWGPRGQEKIFQAYFSSTCGGVTADGADVFSDGDIGPLHAHLADGCEASRLYRWTVTLPKATFAERLRAWGRSKSHPIANMKALRSLAVEDRNALGRPKSYLVIDSAGQRFTLKAEQARSGLGWDAPRESEVFSGSFTPVDQGDQLRLDGQGFGHGVGMCQWCTNGWAKRGQGFDQILKRSFPGAILVRAY